MEFSPGLSSTMLKQVGSSNMERANSASAYENMKAFQNSHKYYKELAEGKKRKRMMKRKTEVGKLGAGLEGNETSLQGREEHREKNEIFMSLSDPIKSPLKKKNYLSLVVRIQIC